MFLCCLLSFFDRNRKFIFLKLFKQRLVNSSWSRFRRFWFSCSKRGWFIFSQTIRVVCERMGWVLFYHWTLRYFSEIYFVKDFLDIIILIVIFNDTKFVLFFYKYTFRKDLFFHLSFKWCLFLGSKNNNQLWLLPINVIIEIDTIT